MDVGKASTAAGENAGQPLETGCASYAHGLAPPASYFSVLTRSRSSMLNDEAEYAE